MPSPPRFVDGEAYVLPFDDASVDVIRCERVFQHLNDPDRAAAEIARVLRRGGRAVVIDTDWETLIVHPGDRAVVRALQDRWLRRSANPLSGRLLRGQLTAAGLAVDEVASQALIQDGSAVAWLIKLMGGAASEEEAITDQQRVELQADLEAAVVRGDFHMSVTMFAPIARKA